MFMRAPDLSALNWFQFKYIVVNTSYTWCLVECVYYRVSKLHVLEMVCNMASYVRPPMFDAYTELVKNP